MKTMRKVWSFLKDPKNNPFTFLLEKNPALLVFLTIIGLAFFWSQVILFVLRTPWVFN